MDFTKAENNQLEVIIKHEYDCPLSLLRGAVSEMLNRSNWDAMINELVRIVVNDMNRSKEVYKMEIADWMQIGRLTIYKALERFNSKKGANFFTFVYRMVKHQFIKELVALQAQKRDTQQTVSYQSETDRGTEFEVFMIDRRQSVERTVINKVLVEQLLNGVNRHQKTVVNYYLQGYNFREISMILGRGNDRNMHQAYKRAIDKMRKGAIYDKRIMQRSI